MAHGAIQRTLRETNTAVEGLSGMVFFIQEKLVPGDGYIYIAATKPAAMTVLWVGRDDTSNAAVGWTLKSRPGAVE